MSDFHKVCRTDEVPEGEGKTVQVEGKLIAVFCENGEYHAIDDTCPHMGASLGSGHVADGIVTCPWHAWRFCIRDGTWADNPRIKIGSYPLRVVEDQIEVQIAPPEQSVPREET